MMATTTTSNPPPVEERFVSINGKVISGSNAATISVFDTSFHRGDGVFEVMRIVPAAPLSKDSTPGVAEIRCLDQHMVRLQTSATAVGCPLPAETTLIQWLKEAVSGCGYQAGSLRLIATKGNSIFDVEPSVIISWSPLPEWPEVFTLYPLLAPWHPAGLPGWETPIKWTSYGPNVVSSKKATQAGFTDALLLSPHRVVERPIPPNSWSDIDQLLQCHVLDGPNFAVAFVENHNKKPILHLPCNQTLGLLPSITQGRVAMVAQVTLGMEVKRGVYTLAQVLDVSDEVFVMSTTRGVKIVTQIGEYAIPFSSSKKGGNQRKKRAPSWASEFSRLLEAT